MKTNLLLIFLPIFLFSQNKLIKNYNPIASILVHSLNERGDSLYLSSKKNISGIKIIDSRDNEKIINTYDQKLFFYPLKDETEGSNTIMVFIDSKIIVFTIIIEKLVIEKIEEVAVVEIEKEPIKNNIELVIPVKTYTENTYNISNKDRRVVQSRAEYRKNNLRPNGKPYN